MLGPYDLSASLGKLGQIDDPAVVAAIDRVLTTCRAAKIPVGHFGVTASAVQPFLERGCTLITAGVDTLFLAQAAGQTLKQLRPSQQTQ
jgi:2-keto-3-deoxy-L-rhamnonate aldolase RhmA